MGLGDKIQNIFKKEENTLETKEVPILKTSWKYPNMKMIAPSKTIHENTDSYFYIEAYDEHNNPIVGETIRFKISGKEYETVTSKNGIGKWLIDLPPKRYTVKVEFPTGDYAPVIETGLRVMKGSPKKKNAQIIKERSDRYTSLQVPKMKMFINNEGQYYAKLRDKTYQPIIGEEIKLTINNKTFSSITDDKGFASFDIRDIKSGSYEVHVEYEGSPRYDPCESKSELKMVVRDIDKEVIIDVEHLTMEFKVTKDKIDTLKEFVIRTLKRNKEEHEKIRVLDDISFKVYKGDKLGILGFNGAGKSTLLKIMSGIYEPTSGTITTKGKIAPLLELGAGFDKNYTGKNNIYLNGSLLSIDEKTLESKYDEIVEFSELGEFINYPIKNYSSGMRTKLGFSIATLINPDILIIDEILSVGDIKFKKKSAKKINSMMQDGVTVLLVSHSISQIKKICDRCIWLEDGHIKMEGDAEEVCDAYVKGANTDIKKETKKKNKK